MEYTYKHNRFRSTNVPSQEEKFIRTIDYDSPEKSIVSDLEIFQKEPYESARTPSKRVVRSANNPPTALVKTLYVAKKNSFDPKKVPNTSTSGTLFAKGDYRSIRTRVPDGNNLKPSTDSHRHKGGIYSVQVSSASCQSTQRGPTPDLQCLLWHTKPKINPYNAKKQITQCYRLSQNLALKSQNRPKHESFNSYKYCTHKTLLTTSSEESFDSSNTLCSSRSRLDHLRNKTILQEMDTDSSSSDDKLSDTNIKRTSETSRPGCSYIEHYSHIPDTSAFQPFIDQEDLPSPQKLLKNSPIEKEHNSEQYGRDFTALDSIGGRQKRHSASVPMHRYERERYDSHRGAAERMNKIRHKLNPVRDYRLMDTVHYLAQGEFAPRDDGIKLTPSREAVLSDIIWEDVCRTHWPNTRLSIRRTHHERRAARSELQHLIDNLLRERVAHVERRRRRHYRIVKLNHRRESRTNPLGKTDVIVASHKDRNENDPKGSDSIQKAANSADERQNLENSSSRKKHKSYDHISLQDSHAHFRADNCSPGPSYVSPKCPENFKTTCCYHTYRPDLAQAPERAPREATESVSTNDCRPNPRTEQILITKDHRRRRCKEETSLNQYILLPTLVKRTPSNIKRQKKFNDLYHRVLKSNSEGESKPLEIPEHKHIGLNVHITLSDRNDDITLIKKQKKL